MDGEKKGWYAITLKIYNRALRVLQVKDCTQSRVMPEIVIYLAQTVQRLWLVELNFGRTHLLFKTQI